MIIISVLLTIVLNLFNR
nr:hypothetical protein [Marinobacter pelagius]